MFENIIGLVAKIWSFFKRKEERTKQQVEGGTEAQTITINVNVKK